MPTEAQPGAALFLFAHQDDEFGVYARIADCRRRGLRVACAYLTDGQTADAGAAKRNAESRAVLARLGVADADIAFAGQELGIGDARLPHHLAAAAAWIEAWIARHGAVESLHLPAWEGGHHDHDALHAAALHAAERRQLLPRSWQYPLYQAAGLPGPWFRVLAPLPENGPVRASAIAWRERLLHLRLCLSYPSQRKTWIGLFPFVALAYLTRGVQSLQPVAPERIASRPHAGKLYYEKRQFFTWEQMNEAIGAWRAASRPL
jgi:LmbE family N-acetylglucosaminyl deacetylase